MDETLETLIGVLTVSDTRTPENDLSGDAIEHGLRSLGFHHLRRELCRDESNEIQSKLIELSLQCTVVLTTGGTGFSPRDVTPEATAAVIERQATSISELIRTKGLQHTPYSHLSRGISGIRGNTIMINLPGSPAGASQSLEALAPLLPPSSPP